MLVAVGVVALVGALACTGLALAGKHRVRLEVRATTATVAAGSSQPNVKASCRRGHLASAGFKLFGSSPTGILAAALQPGKYDVQARLQNLSTTPQRGRIEAYCARGLRTRVRLENTILPSNGLTTVKVSCPGGSKAISGGFRTANVDLSPSGTRALTVSSHRAGGRKWAATALTWGDSGPGVIQGYAVCAKGVKVRSVSAKSRVGTAPTKTNVRCRGRSRVVAGGFKALGGTGAGSMPIPLASRRKNARTWQYVAAGSAGAGPARTKVWAYCTKKL